MACQIEIRNTWPKLWFNHAQDEIMTIMACVMDVIQNDFGLGISATVAPDYDNPVPSSNKYSSIVEILEGVSEEVRKATNIAWLHLNYDNTLLEHALEWNKIREDFLMKKYDKLGFTKERLKKYSMVVEALQTNWIYNTPVEWVFTSDEKIKEWKFLELVDTYWEALGNHSIYRLKKLKSSYVSELRTFDWWTSLEDLEKKTRDAYNYILNIKG